jgi:hypothetical protein
VFILEKEVEEAVTTLSEGCGKTDLEWQVRYLKHDTTSS